MININVIESDRLVILDFVNGATLDLAVTNPMEFSDVKPLTFISNVPSAPINFIKK